MSNEIFEINNVKTEFLQNIGTEYTQVFSERQLEMSIYMLNDFCDALAKNNLVLLRIEQEPEQAPVYRAPPTPQMGIPPQYQQQYQQPQYQQAPQYQDPFQEQQLVQQQIRELNAQLPKLQPLPSNVKQYPEMRPQFSRDQLDNVPAAPTQEVDLAAEKPKSFADKIREMRAGTKKPNRINPDDNE